MFFVMLCFSAVGKQDKMRDFKGTKGEWTIKGGKFGELMIALNNKYLDASGYEYDSDLICVEVTAPNVKEVEANANLIAAAPKMLEALQNIENDDNSIPKHAWDMIQNAIDCALGNKA